MWVNLSQYCPSSTDLGADPVMQVFDQRKPHSLLIFTPHAPSGHEERILESTNERTLDIKYFWGTLHAAHGKERTYKNPHVLKFELIISWNYFAHYKMWIPPDFCKIRGGQMMTGGLGSDARIARWANEGPVSRSRDHSRLMRGSNEARWCIGVRTNCSHTSLIFWTNQRPVMSWGDHSGPIRGQSLVSRPRPLMVILLTFPCITIIPASVLQYTPIQRLRRQFETCSCLLNNSIHNF